MVADSIKAEDLIRRIETNMKPTTLNLSDEMAFLYFEMALKGNANEWLFSQKRYINCSKKDKSYRFD